MKKIFTYSIVAALAAILFTSCTKDRIHNDSSYWLSQESGNVVYSNNSCGYYAVETQYGYTIIQNLDGFRTYEGDVMFGNFGGIGTRDFYNHTANVVTRGTVMEYDLTYNEALAALDYYCPVAGANGFRMLQSATAQSKIKRTATTVPQ
ncbi:MAG: hypothetical protein JWR61_1393 [Ferruginibacter sp.]|jgi:hypothetical protein|uniref:hypothetical protein n=1 Tax=Ferruginibacter sp. TaxID=1940288 RepID=UPI0026595D1A|nr:hypothetical protein [Ferruginibacter sp.]MDB5276438.1 hypothetical protein [Ferruginibacter sp.]